MDNFGDKISAFLKGPGWFPGTPRLGDPTGVPEIQHRQKYNPKVAGWNHVYTVIHFLLVFLAFDDLGRYNLVSFCQKCKLLVNDLFVYYSSRYIAFFQFQN